MEQHIYYLSSDDYSLTPVPRKCRVVGIARRSDDFSALIQVELLESVPNRDYDARHLLLSPVDPTLQLSDIRKRPFMVNIYIARHDSLQDTYRPTDLVDHPGTGQLHSSWDEAAKRCSKPLVRDPVQVAVSSIRILGEQDGEPERFIKAKIADFLRQTGYRCRAYLARVEYDVPGEFNVALFVRLETGDAKELVNAGIGNIFYETFKRDQHLDVLFLTQSEEEGIAAIVKPFFSSAE